MRPFTNYVSEIGSGWIRVVPPPGTWGPRRLRLGSWRVPIDNGECVWRDWEGWVDQVPLVVPEGVNDCYDRGMEGVYVVSRSRIE